MCEISALLDNDLLFLQPTVEIVERGKFSLHQATAIPMDTPEGRLIVSSTYNHFLLNQEEDKFIYLNERELKNGKSLGHNDSLYRTASDILLSPEDICEWNLFANDELDNALKSCKVLPSGK